MSLYLSLCSRSLNWTELDKMCTLTMKSMTFVSSAWPERSASQVMVCKGANIFFMFLSLCVLSRIFFFFFFYSCIWAKDVKAALQMSAFIHWSALTRKKCLRPISFVKDLLQNETCPRPGLFFYFFCPKDTWAHAAWLPAWTRRRRSCRHSSGAWHHHQPISCWNVDLENVEVMPVQQNIRSVGGQQSSPWMWWKSWFKH